MVVNPIFCNPNAGTAARIALAALGFVPSLTQHMSVRLCVVGNVAGAAAVQYKYWFVAFAK